VSHAAVRAALPSLPDASWDAIVPHLTSRSLTRGETLVRAGDTVDSVAFVRAGLLRMYYLRADGREFNKSFLGPGAFCGVLDALASGAPSRLSISALAATELTVLPWATFDALCRRDLAWSEVGRQMAQGLAVKKMRKEAGLLLDTAEQRYETFLAEFSELESVIADYQIASYLGITPEALSRIRRRRSKLQSPMR